MQSFSYVIVGGGMAGGRAAENIRQVDPDGPLALVAGEPYLPYDRPPLSKGYLTGAEGLEAVYLKGAEFYPEQGIELFLGVRAVGLDPAGRRLMLADGRELGYDKLLLATGGVARRLPIPGADLPGVHTLRTIDDADAIRRAAGSARRALVVGGSFIGSEAAAALAELGPEVSIVFPEGRLLERVVPEELSAFLHAKYEERGVRFFSGRRPARLEGAGRVERAILDDGQGLEVDLVVLGVGIELDTVLARGAGLALDERGGVLVDETLRSSDPHVYAAGDIANWPDTTSGRRRRVEHWDVARRQGIRAGLNMAGDVKPYTAVPYFYSDLFHQALEAWGDLGAWDRIVQRGALDSGHFYLFYFQQGRLAGVLVGNPRREERKQMGALVRAGLAEDAADSLRDEGVDLETLLL